MKVKAINRFEDLAEKVQREAGDVFDVTEERFKEILEKLPGYLEEVTEDKKTKEKAEK